MLERPPAPHTNNRDPVPQTIVGVMGQVFFEILETGVWTCDANVSEEKATPLEWVITAISTPSAKLADLCRQKLPIPRGRVPEPCVREFGRENRKREFAYRSLNVAPNQRTIVRPNQLKNPRCSDLTPERLD